jgi:hypothetical protein
MQTSVQKNGDNFLLRSLLGISKANVMRTSEKEKLNDDCATESYDSTATAASWAAVPQHILGIVLSMSFPVVKMKTSDRWLGTYTAQWL